MIYTALPPAAEGALAQVGVKLGAVCRFRKEKR
jgi:hypothetical protein